MNEAKQRIRNIFGVFGELIQVFKVIASCITFGIGSFLFLLCPIKNFPDYRQFVSSWGDAIRKEMNNNGKEISK